MKKAQQSMYESVPAATEHLHLRNASSLGVTTTDYSLWGSSAGARMAAAIGSYGTAWFALRIYRSRRPSFLYTGSFGSHFNRISDVRRRW